jgi:hypothetical protein
VRCTKYWEWCSDECTDEHGTGLSSPGLHKMLLTTSLVIWLISWLVS